MGSRATQVAALAVAISIFYIWSTSAALFYDQRYAKHQEYVPRSCAMLPQSMIGEEAYACCDAHSRIYAEGGSRELRKSVDGDLLLCLRETNVSSSFANSVYFGVRILGVPVLPTPWRWGYSWSYGKSYRE